MNRFSVLNIAGSFRRRRLVVLAACVFLCPLFSCTSQFERDQMSMDRLYSQQKFKEAARTLLSHINAKGKNQLLAQMECGLLLNAAGDYEKSSELFIAAGELAKTIPVSISQQGAAMLLNDTVTNYRGEDFERVLIHMYSGIDFLVLGKLDEARVEFKRVNDVLQSYRDAGYRSFKQNLMAKYLTAIAFEMASDATNDPEDLEFAYIELKQIYKLSPENPLIKRELLRVAKKMKDPEEISQWKSRFGDIVSLSGDGEIDVVYQAGTAARKKSRGKLMSDPAMANAVRAAIDAGRVSWQAGVTVGAVTLFLATAEHPIPKYVEMPNKIDYVAVVSDGQEVSKSVALENVTETALNTMEEKYNTIRARVAIGIVTKAVAAVVAGLIAEKIAESSKKSNGVAGLVGAVVGLGTGAALASQIKPDLRCWHSLPDNLQLAFAPLAPGKHNVSLRFYSRGAVLEEAAIGEVEVVGGQRKVINFRTVY